jgi:hypothetical protein
MRTELPKAIAHYIQAKQSHNTEALLATLADDAVITDEGKDYRGKDAIRQWSNATSSEFQATYDVTDVVEYDKETVVGVKVTGNFPGSPVILPIHFTLKDDKIATVLVVAP